MMCSEEIYNLLKGYYHGFLKPDHELFHTNNLNLLQPYKKLGAISNEENEICKNSVSSGENTISCNAFGCSVIFDSIVSYQSHYNGMHRFTCVECKKSLPTDHLLDLHILEQHDSYFMARIERGESLFKCYLEECKEVFGNPSDRKKHCIMQHKFPSNFRFNQICRKNYHNRKSKKHAKEMLMEVVEETKQKDCKKNREFKQFSFGHQLEKTFCPTNFSNSKTDTSKILENMDSLKESLKSV